MLVSSSDGGALGWPGLWGDGHETGCSALREALAVGSVALVLGGSGRGLEVRTLSTGRAEGAREGRTVRRAASSDARPRLHVVGGGSEDAVLRWQRFEAAHPEIMITPPGTLAPMWTAYRDGNSLARRYHLGALLDELGRLCGEQP
jgi:hypothetical protein